MNKQDKIISLILNYLPGLIILVVGFFGLQNAKQIISNHESYVISYSKLGEDIVRQQENIIEFEGSYYSFIRDNSPDSYKNFKKLFLNLEQVHKDVISGYEGIDLKNQDLEHIFSLINSEITSIDEIIRLYDDGEKHTPLLFDIKAKNGAHDRIDNIIKHNGQLQKNFFFMIDLMLKSKKYKDIGRQLFWSIMVIFLSGFILVMLNSFRLQQIQKNALENNTTVKLLRSRQAAIESSHDGLMIINNEGLLTYANPAFLKIYGFDRDKAKDIIGKIWYDIFSEDDAHKIKYEVIPTLQSQGFWRGRFTMNRENGQKVYTEFSLTKLEDGGLIGATLDITEEYRAREEKNKLEDQFYQAQKMEAIGRLTGGIAHDFNNILAAMNGNAEFLIEDLPANSPQQKFAQNILKAGKQARDLVDRMLAFSRRSDSATQMIDIVESVQETVAMLKASLPKTIKIYENLQTDYAMINANTTHITQTIMNLCVNAKDAIEEGDGHGDLTIGVALINSEDFNISWAVQADYPQPQQTPLIRIDDVSDIQTRLALGHIKMGAPYVCLTIRDTGIGMSRTIMEHIFEPFFTTKSVDKGTGLGLATVHGVIAGHQGMMIVDSILNQGTIFSLYFPAIERSQIDMLNKTAQKWNKVTQNQNQSELPILLVEDQDTVRDMMQNMLERLSYKVETAMNGLEALDLIRERPNHFSLVISDHNMPIMTGLELVQQVHLDLPDLPFILVSGYSQSEIQDIQKSHPAIRAVIRKPVTKDNLDQKIKSALGLESA